MNATELHVKKDVKNIEKHRFQQHRVELRHSNCCSNSSKGHAMPLWWEATQLSVQDPCYIPLYCY